MIVNREVPFSVGRKKFAGICGLGFSRRGAFVIEAWTTPPPEPRGTYFTSLAISPVAYRREHPTAAAFRREGSRLFVYDDWGAQTTIRAPPDVLDTLEAECATHLPRLPPQAPPSP